jgi:hypothetical protein
MHDRWCPVPERRIHNGRNPSAVSSSNGRATICTPIGNPSGELPHRHHRRRRSQHVEPLRVPHRIEVLHF